MAKQQQRETDVSQRTPEGFILTVSRQEKIAGVFMLIFSLCWIAISLTILFAQLSTGVNPITLFGIALVGVFVFVGLVILFFALLEIWVNLWLGPAELILPKYPLRLGETCAIHYRRRLRRGTLRQSARIQAQFICDEWVQYHQGTDTVTKTHTLWEKQLPERTVVSGESQADYLGEIKILSQGPPSFSAKHNKIRWQLEIKLKVPGIPQVCKSTFLLKVIPEAVA